MGAYHLIVLVLFEQRIAEAGVGTEGP